MKNLNWQKLLLPILITIFVFIIGKDLEETSIKNIATVAAVGIDIDEEHLYHISIQILNPSSLQRNASGEALGYVIYEEKGRTISEAIRKASNRISRRIFLDNTEIVIVSEKAAKKGITEVIDFLIQEPHISANLKFFIAKEHKPATILKLFTPIHKVSANRINELIENVEKNFGSANALYPNKIKNYLLNKVVSNISIPYITIMGDIEKGLTKENIGTYATSASLKIGGMGFFKGDKLIEFLNEEESKTLLLLNGNLRGTIIEAKCPKDEVNKFVAMNLNNAKTKLDYKVKNGQPSFTIHVNVNGEIHESNCSTNFEYPNIKMYEKHLKSEFKEDIESLLEKSQEQNADFIGLAKFIYLTNPMLWHELKEDWDQIYPETPIDVKVKVSITETGETMKIP